MRILLLGAAMVLTMATSSEDDAWAKKGKPAAGPSASTTSGAPVDVSVTPPAAGKRSFKYKVTVHAEKPVEQVDLKMKYTDDKGAKVDESTFMWQNVQSMKKQPIEKGKTYEVEDDLMPNSTKVEIAVEKVHYKDGSTWSPAGK